jgi:hypothetical protein
MKKLLVVFISVLIFFVLYLYNIHNIVTLSIIMLTHFNGIPAPTWIIMNSSYTYGPYLTIPLMSALWFINSTLFFYYWRWVIYYRKGKDISDEYTNYLKTKSEKSWIYRLVLKGINTNLKWYYVMFIRLIPTPLSSNILICSSFRKLSSLNFMIGNAIAILITTTYFSFAINLIKMSEVPNFIKNILYLIHMC